MRPPFAIRLALREGRASLRRLGLYMGAITVGVAALVAINSFRVSVTESVQAESRSLLGADYRLSSGRVFPDSVAAAIDSMEAAGHGVAHVTGTLSVALGPGGATRLVQVRGVRGAYPFYGEVVTDPPQLWPPAGGRDALVEPGLLIALDARVGDTLRIGSLGFRVSGTLTKGPLEIGFRSAIAPRVFIAERWLEEAGLLAFGSIVTYQAFLRIADADVLQRFEDLHHDLFRRNLVNFTSAREEAEELTDGFEWMSRFLGLVALIALLLGGLGVASAVHVFVREKQTQVATLRCLGATRRTAFLAYLLQSGVLGLAGALLGALLGVAVQGVLPSILGDAVPVDLPFRVEWRQVVTGIGLGVWVSLAFALLPLLSLRSVPPLQALRHAVERPQRRFDGWVLATWGAIAATVLLLAVWQAPEPMTGLGYAAALAGSLGLLRGVAWALTRLAHRLFPRRASFAVRQGVSGLFRPSNQTTAVILVLGFGVFLISSIWIVQTNLLDRFAIDRNRAAPNLVAFDIQRDQRNDVTNAFVRLGVDRPELVPIVPARIAAINDVDAGEILSSPRVRDIEPWALRREYRNTYRAHLTDAETLREGEWWTDNATAATPAPADPARVSIEEGLASSLDLHVGDRITWDVQGVRIATVVASIRAVDWTRLETNFFVVFEPGVVDAAPQTWVTLARVPDASAMAAIQRELVQRHPNVSTLDLSLIEKTIADVLGRVTLAIRFMAVFAAVCGGLVLAGALSAGRHQRTREAVLLRTLGASRRTVRQTLLTEYVALGTLAGVAGAVMSIVASWALVRFLFELPYRIPALPVFVACVGVALFAALIGAAGNRTVFAGPPLAVLRQAD